MQKDEMENIFRAAKTQARVIMEKFENKCDELKVTDAIKRKAKIVPIQKNKIQGHWVTKLNYMSSENNHKT